MTLRRGIVTVLTRPFRPVSWRELGYLLLGGPMSVVAFGEVVGMVTGSLVLLVTLLGIPLFLVKTYLERGLAGIERRRAGSLLREAIEGRYRDASGGGFWHRVRVVAGDPQTWRDFLWLVLLSPLGFGFAVAAASLWGSAVYLLSLPVWWWFPTPPSPTSVRTGPRTAGRAWPPSPRRAVRSCS